MRRIFHVFWVVALCLSVFPPVAFSASWTDQIEKLAGGGAVLAVDSENRILVSLNPDKELQPASSLKVVTAAAALDILGPDYRFTTDFRLDSNLDLWVSGRGDPFLVSEEIDALVLELKAKGLAEVRDLVLDNSFFTPNLILDGTSRSLNPYDAYNGALCVNFNTIKASIDAGGKVAAAEPQTPLTDMARELAVKTGARGSVRFNLSDHPNTCLLYAGDLIRAFLEKHGVTVTGRIRPADGPVPDIPIFHTRRSSWSLLQLLEKTLEFSNNFMANQIFLTMGAEKYGPPASAEKSRKALAFFLHKMEIPPMKIEEGSGLSRQNRVSASQMLRVLTVFKPYYEILVHENRAYFKTGTMSGVRTLVGYIDPAGNDVVRFVILLNGREAVDGAREKILKLLEENLN